MGLQEEIDSKSSQIKTDSYPMSIGELLNLYRDGELDVHPEFQRIFRWTDAQKTRLIESILLGIPMPPIFVAQRPDGVWDVVDGVQRLSTILQFVGELKDEDGKPVPPLVLEKTKFLPSLEGKTWNSANQFTKSQKLFVKRAKIDMNIVLKESDEKAKFELFMRLNTGGTVLEPQEVRNCLMVMAYRDTYKWVKTLSEEESFRKATPLSDQAVLQKYPMELVTRFLIFRTLSETGGDPNATPPVPDLSQVADIGEFMNEHVEYLDLLRRTRQEVEEQAFRETFRFIYGELEDDAFRRFDRTKNRFLGGFSISAFEAVALGVGYQVNARGELLPIRNFRKKVQSIWSNDEFTENSGSGVRASVRIPRIIPMGRRLFAP